jgi:ABC-type multidrug transport system ATPase subunit
VIPIVVSARDVTVQYGRRLVFERVSFSLEAGQSLGVVGAAGVGKTALLRTVVGILHPREGEVRINGLLPHDALRRTGVAYFAGEATLPGAARARDWGRLGSGDLVTSDRRRIRALSRGTRQLLGLRTVLGRHPLGLVVLDEPWEALDADAAGWLTATLEAKRDRGAAVIVSSHRLYDLAGLCDAYLFLVTHRARLLQARAITPSAAVTAPMLADVLERLRSSHSSLPSSIHDRTE